MSKENINELFNLFDNLKQKAIKEQATFKDVESLMQGIYNLTLSVKDENIDLLIKGLGKLSKNYTSLFSILMQSFKEAKEDQIKYAKIENLKQQVENSKLLRKC